MTVQSRPVPAMPVSIKMNALLYRIWGYAHPREWDVTTRDIAVALDKRPTDIGRALRLAGWHNRIRASERGVFSLGDLTTQIRETSIAHAVAFDLGYVHGEEEE